MGNKTISTVLAVLAIVVLAAPVTFTTFAVLRLCNVISWSWWIITLPLWASALAVISVLTAYAIIIFAARSVLLPKTFRKKGGIK